MKPANTSGFCLCDVVGYTKPIRTKNAEYVVSLEDHDIPDYSAFKSRKFDFVVIETRMEKGAYEFKQIRKLQKIAKCDILVLDPSPTNLQFNLAATKQVAGSVLAGLGVFCIIKSCGGKPTAVARRSFLKAGLGLFAGAHLFGPIVPTMVAGPLLQIRGEIRARSLLMDILARSAKLYEPVLVDARNAIIAEKLEGTIVPALRKELGRTPHIVIQIGSAHGGIVEYLQDEGARRAAIFRLRDKISEGLVREHLDKAYRVRWDEKAKDLRFEEIKAPITPLLEHKKPMKLSRRQFFRRFVKG